MKRYAQHCPISRAVELLTEPWTLLVVRELLRGSEKVSDIGRGVPGMSATLLATRLRTLEGAGLIRSFGAPGDAAYRLTQAGRELAPIVEGLGRWGQRWLPRPRLRDYDAGLLMLDISREVDQSALPERPVAVQVVFAEGGSRRTWWLVLARTQVSAVNHRPDLAAALRIECTTAALTEVWLGHLTWLQAVRDGVIRFVGDRETAHHVLGWIGTSRFATVPRGADGDDDVGVPRVMTVTPPRRGLDCTVRTVAHV